MNKKEKLLNSLDGLEMSFKKKQEFVNILVGNSGSDSDGSDISGESNIEYLDISGYDTQSLERSAFISGAIYSKMDFNGRVLIAPLIQGYVEAGGDMMKLLGAVKAVSVDFKMKGVFDTDYGLQTFEESLTSNLTNIDLTSIPRITKEEFYNLNSDSN